MVLQMDTQEATMRKMNPNDVNHVVWAISTCFFFLIMFFLYANHIYKFHRYYGVTEGLAGGYDGEIGPKRRVSRCLGHSVSIF